jgi:hypothetical protein
MVGTGATVEISVVDRCSGRFTFAYFLHTRGRKKGGFVRSWTNESCDWSLRVGADVIYRLTHRIGAEIHSVRVKPITVRLAIDGRLV